MPIAQVGCVGRGATKIPHPELLFVAQFRSRILRRLRQRQFLGGHRVAIKMTRHAHLPNLRDKLFGAGEHLIACVQDFGIAISPLLPELPCLVAKHKRGDLVLLAAENQVVHQTDPSASRRRCFLQDKQDSSVRRHPVEK